MNIAKDSVVFVHYTLTDEGGNVLDETLDGQPRAYLHGHRNIIPGLESQLEGKSVGDKLLAVVEAADAYGEKDSEAIESLPRDQFHGVDNIEVGMEFESQINGKTTQATVIAVTDDTVTIDGNHPFAGKQLTFDIEVIEVREGTTSEIAHGHVHGRGGVNH